MNNKAPSAAPVAAPIKLPNKPLWQDVVAPTYKGGGSAWLLTFVDLTGLMVVFFVLMFSRQTLQSDKWDVIAGSFKAKFAAPEAVVLDVVDGANNAEEIRFAKDVSGLGYLNILMQKHLETSATWKGLQGQDVDGVRGDEMVYNIPANLRDPVAAKAAWQELAVALRGWKNPVGVRVRAAQADLPQAAYKAQKLVVVLQEYGLPDAFAEVGAGVDTVELVVRAR